MSDRRSPRSVFDCAAVLPCSHLVAQLVRDGQLQFIVGGWTMEDEGCTTYSANIDQMTEGHQLIVSLFGEAAGPKYGWQIDPFGHSNVVHEQFHWMGFNATVLDRIQSGLKQSLINNKSLEMMWQTSGSLGSSTQIFTHIMDKGMYFTPVRGLEWDSGDPRVTDLNINKLADGIVANLHKRANYSLTPHVLFPWGFDFQHYGCAKDMDNMDLLIAYINKHSATYGVKVCLSLKHAARSRPAGAVLDAVGLL